MTSESPAPSGGPLAETLLGLEPPLQAEAVEKLGRLFDLLRSWKGAGLFGFRSAEDLARHYFREALELRPLLPADGPFLDVGSGGGTPALPLAIAQGAGDWILLEPRSTPAAFLEMAAESLGLEARVRVVRERLKHFLNLERGRDDLARVSAVTVRAVRLQAPEWRGLARALSAGTPVIWPTSRAARTRAALEEGLFEESFTPAERGVVWIGRPRHNGQGDSSRNVSRETSRSTP